MKLFTGTTVVVAPALEVTTVTHIWLPLRKSVDVGDPVNGLADWAYAFAISMPALASLVS